jgi:methionyl-tRNA synthetase
VSDALDGFRLRDAALAITTVIGAANRYVQVRRPWELTDPTDAAAFDGIVGPLVAAARTVVAELTPFVPSLTERAARQLGGDGPTTPPPKPVVPRLATRG